MYYPKYKYIACYVNLDLLISKTFIATKKYRMKSAMTLTMARPNEIQSKTISSSLENTLSAYIIVKACIGDKNVAAKNIIIGATPI